ncbi:type 4 pilus major pilin [Cupriavidus pinatubonensis]|uniref:Type 4 secretion system PilS N-terminal domain-containing protein n=1 Tax=Cupriavidus pinatubonensis TaxID=248026 RepID=A0ABN7Y9J6_9BURK|nr:type 4 pilus major pilin [Cupriavidus pinatubonensis]CAG9170075.1 hypothetical protein LMG23994_01807 [Cupriavidus pinatubonensis]
MTKTTRSSFMNRNWKAKEGQKGFTALELIVVLIVGLGIIALAASRMDMLFGNSNVNEETANLSTLLSNTRNLKTISGYGAAGANLVPQLISTNGLPKNMTVTAGVPYNVWGGAVTVISNGLTHSIGYATVPQDACVKMATKGNKGGVFASVKVNAATAVTGEYTTAQATTDCSSATANTITWTSNT